MKSIFIFLIAAGFSLNVFSQTTDSTAIVQVLEKESTTWRSGDTTAHAVCWQIEPYSTIIVMTPQGKTFSTAADKILHPAPGTMGKGGSFVNTNYHMSIHGNGALATHDETSTSVGGSITHTFEVCMLKKISGQWKLTGQIIQIL